MISDKSEIIDYGDKKIDYSDLTTKKYFFRVYTFVYDH